MKQRKKQKIKMQLNKILSQKGSIIEVSLIKKKSQKTRSQS